MHRVFSIIVYNDKRELLLQRRALDKYHTPNYGLIHVVVIHMSMKADEAIINRRLYQEMGI